MRTNHNQLVVWRVYVLATTLMSHVQLFSLKITNGPTIIKFSRVTVFVVAVSLVLALPKCLYVLNLYVAQVLASRLPDYT